jgi:hypothetical protein
MDKSEKLAQVSVRAATLARRAVCCRVMVDSFEGWRCQSLLRAQLTLHEHSRFYGVADSRKKLPPVRATALSHDRSNY